MSPPEMQPLTLSGFRLAIYAARCPADAENNMVIYWRDASPLPALVFGPIGVNRHLFNHVRVESDTSAADNSVDAVKKLAAAVLSGSVDPDTIVVSITIREIPSHRGFPDKNTLARLSVFREQKNAQVHSAD